MGGRQGLVERMMVVAYSSLPLTVQDSVEQEHLVSPLLLSPWT
jgi:hypothetical protein